MLKVVQIGENRALADTGATFLKFGLFEKTKNQTAHDIFKHIFWKGGRQQISVKATKQASQNHVKNGRKTGLQATRAGPVKLRWGGVPTEILQASLPRGLEYTLLPLQLVLRGTVADTAMHVYAR